MVPAEIRRAAERTDQCGEVPRQTGLLVCHVAASAGPDRSVMGAV